MCQVKPGFPLSNLNNWGQEANSDSNEVEHWFNLAIDLTYKRCSLLVGSIPN